MRIITDKILLSSLLAGSLFLAGCSIGEEGGTIKPTTTVDPAAAKITNDKKPKQVEITIVEECEPSILGSLGGFFGVKEECSPKTVTNDKDDKDDKPKEKDSKQAAIEKIKAAAEVERKKRIAAVKEGNISAKVRAKIAKDTRLEDVESKFQKELNSLNGQLKSEEKDLVKVMKVDLDEKNKALEVEIESKIAQIKVEAKNQQVSTITKVERTIADKQGEVVEKNIDTMIEDRLKRSQEFNLREGQLHQDYLGELSTTKFTLNKEAEKQLIIMDQNIRANVQAHLERKKVKMASLERQRIDTAIEVEKREKAKNQAIIDDIIKKFDEEVKEYIEETKSELDQHEKMTMAKIDSIYKERKSIRQSVEDKYKEGQKDKIKKVGLDAAKNARNSLTNQMNSDIETINRGVDSSISKVEVDKENSLSQLKTDNQAQHEQKKSDLKAEYKRKIQDLKSQAAAEKSAIKSKARERDARLRNDERKEIKIIESQISSDVKAKIDAVKL